MYLNDRRLVDSEDRTLRAAIEEAVGGERSAPLILRADRQTPHHFVVTAMDVAAQLGFTNLSIATDRVDGPAE
jgi:biopolymer transport protein ExbD